VRLTRRSPSWARTRRPLSPRGVNHGFGSSQELGRTQHELAQPAPPPAKSAAPPLIAQRDAVHSQRTQLPPAAAAAAAAAPAASPPEHPPERLEALAAARAEAYKLEVQELRVSVARAHLKIQTQQEEHAAQLAALQAELEARGRGEMLTRTRCEAYEADLRSLRKENQRLRDQIKRDASAKHAAMSEDLAERCKKSTQAFVTQGLMSAVLGWQRRKLDETFGRWLVTCAWIEFAQAEATARRLSMQGDASISELHQFRRSTCARQLVRNFELGSRERLCSAVREWRLAVCAAAAEADLRDLAGRLRSAQAGMVQVLDGRASAEGVIHQQAALGRAVLGVAARLAARRELKDRKSALLGAFRPWLLLVADERLRAAAVDRATLLGTVDEGSSISRRADGLAAEIKLLRNNLAAATKRAREAVAEAEAAGAKAREAEEAKEKADALSRLARSKAEGLERDKYAAIKAARTERQTGLLIRRGVVAMAMRAALRRADELRLASAIARWAVAVDMVNPTFPERSLPERSRR
jgi:hypothetical protein